MTNSEEKHRVSSEGEYSVRRNTGTHTESHLKRGKTATAKGCLKPPELKETREDSLPGP